MRAAQLMRAHAGTAPSTLLRSAASTSVSGSPSRAALSRKTALVFPGQGSQRVGPSVRALEEAWPNIVRPVWQELDETVKANISRTMKEGLMSELQPTDIAQPAILAHSYALWLVLLRTFGARDAKELGISVALGHSLGEYTALLAAGSIDFASAVRLVHTRGTAMKHATREGEGGMVALLCDSTATGLHIPSVEQLLQHAQEATKRPVQLANLNSPFQIVISGHRDALTFVREAINRPKNAAAATSAATGGSKGPDLAAFTRGIMKAVPLDVSGPFHSSMMSPALEALRAALQSVRFSEPSVPVIFNVHAHASRRPEKFAQYLEQQLLSPVQWHRSVLHAMSVHGCTEFLELGPSTPLSTMLRSTAARLEKQGRVIDPTIHPVDAAKPGAPSPHPSILPLLVPKPRVLLRVSSDAAGTEGGSSGQSQIDADDALAGVPMAWGAVRTAGASNVEEMRALIAKLEAEGKQVHSD